MRRTTKGRTGGKKYSEDQVRYILRSCGVKVVAETEHDFLCFCPIHNNRNTPSLSVSKTKDGYLCFNAECAASGTLVNLVSRTMHKNQNEALRFIMLNQPTFGNDFEETLEEVLSQAPDYREFSPEVQRGLVEGMATPGNPGRAYMHGRGFSDDTIDYFEVGYSLRRNMVTVPVHSPDGLEVGVVGRIADRDKKIFKNSKELPTNKTYFNLHRAKRASNTCVITESSFDTMANHQSGFPNAIGTLGGHISDYKMALIDRYFDRIIIFTDNRDIDSAGRALGEKIADTFISTKDVLWAQYSYVETYPQGLKDSSGILEHLGEEAVAACVVNAISHFEYTQSMV